MSSNTTPLMVVTIDGPAGSGKSTMAKALAMALGWHKLDTGAIYRSLAWYARQQQVSWDDETGLATLCETLPLRFEGDRVYMADDDITTAIREPEMSRGASVVSAHPAARAALLDLQRNLAAVEPCVAEGRDTGTVVFPNAFMKFFLNATLEQRAQRRYLELSEAGQQVSLDDIRKAEQERDERDSNRAVAPLCKPDDAVEIDSTTMSIQDVLKEMERHVRQRLEN